MKSPASRWLATLAAACAAGALAARGLSSGTGQALLAPGSVLVLDAICLTAALATVAARFLEEEPALVAPRPVLAALALFLGLAWIGAARGANGAWRTAFSWSALAALGLAVHDLGRRKDVGRALASTIVGVATAAAVLGIYDFFFLRPTAKDLESLPETLREAGLWRISDPQATGPFLLASHFACALGMVVPLVLTAHVAAVRRKRWATAILLSLVLGSLAVGIVLAKSKGATLALLVSLVAFFLMAVESPLWRRRLVGLGALALGLVLAVGAYKFVRHRNEFGVGNSASVRLEYWRATLSMIRDHPLAGNGLETFPELFSSHKIASAEETRHAHLDVLELGAELGVFGGLAFLASIVALGRSGLAALREGGKGAAPPHGLALPPTIAVALGLAVGVLILTGQGFPYDASMPEHLVAGAFVAGLVGQLVFRALEDPALGRAAAAAALAGALVFVADGFTDFPLRVHGLVAFALALALLVPALAGAREEDRASPVLRVIVALPVIVLVLVALSLARAEAVNDYRRSHARDLADDALRRIHSGQRLKLEEDDVITEELDEAAVTLRRLLEEKELNVSDVLLLVEVEEVHGRKTRDMARFVGIRAILEDALRQYPRSWALLGALARHQADANLREEATRTFDLAAANYPTNPKVRLDAAVIRVWRIVCGEPPEKLTQEAVHELRAALACARTSRLDRLHLSEAEIAAARGLLIALGEAPAEAGKGEPEPALAPRN